MIEHQLRTPTHLILNLMFADIKYLKNKPILKKGISISN